MILLATDFLSDVIGYALGILIGGSLLAWIFSWFFQPARILRHLRAQTKLITRMAEKVGVPSDEVDGILNSTLK